MPSETSNAIVIGASGAIGSALTRQLASRSCARVHALSRSALDFDQANVRCSAIDLLDEDSVADAARRVTGDGPLDLVLVASGMLHDGELMPEKSLRELNMENMSRVFNVNSFGPALVMKHFLPQLRRQSRSVFAALSARVSSMDDNRLGGWYSYRAAKAALNMLIRTASLEVARSNRRAIVVGLHPGTVASDLSAPFHNNVAPGKLFTPEYSAAQLLQVIDDLDREDSGHLLAWDGQTIAF